MELNQPVEEFSEKMKIVQVSAISPKKACQIVCPNETSCPVKKFLKNNENCAGDCHFKIGSTQFQKDQQKIQTACQINRPNEASCSLKKFSKNSETCARGCRFLGRVDPN